MMTDPDIRHPVRTVLESILRLGAILGSVAMWLIGAIVVYDVILRYLGHPTLWALEISTYLMIGVATFGSGLAVIRNDHFSVDIVPLALKAPWRGILRFVSYALCLALLIFVTYGFWRLISISVRLDMKSATLLRIPMVIPQSAVFAGFALMTLAFAMKLFSSRD